MDKKQIDMNTLNKVNGVVCEESEDFYKIYIPLEKHQQFLILNRAKIIKHKHDKTQKVYYWLRYLKG